MEEDLVFLWDYFDQGDGAPFSNASSPAPLRLSTNFVPPNEPVRAARQCLDIASRWANRSRRSDVGESGGLSSPVMRILVVAVIAVAVANWKKKKIMELWWNSVKKAKLVVELFSAYVSLTVSMSETMGAIKDQVCDKIAIDIGQTIAAEPELFHMFLLPEDWHQGLLLDGDPSKTLEQVLKDCERWKYEFDDKESSKVIILPIGLNSWWVESEGEDEDEEVECPTLERPDILPDDTHSFRVAGSLLASRTTDRGEVKRRCIPPAGPTYPLKSIHNLETTASHVLLAFNYGSFDALSTYVLTNKFEDLVCLQVNWDKFSYLFLRKLRHHLGPQVHILAVTDLDVHHFDMLAFLDTPPRYLPEYYGWELSEQCAHLGVEDIDVLIKWLGIRPTDYVDGSIYRGCFPDCASNKVPVHSADLCRSLLKHPLVSSRALWLDELTIMSAHELYCLPLLSTQWNERTRNKQYKCYLPLKIKRCDWY